MKVTREQGGDGMVPLEKYIIIDGVKLQPGVGGWSGFIYPTGLKARAQGRDNVPVYCDSLDDALKLVNRYFEMYSSFAASGSAAGNAEIPDQTAAAGGNTESAAAADGVVINYYDDDDDGYYMGGSYWPVWWWNNNRPPKPPHHPHHPHHPPKPGPKPPKPGDRPVKPDHRPVKPGNTAGAISGAVKPESGKVPNRVKGISGSAVPVKAVKTPQTVTKISSDGRPVSVERCGNFSRVHSPVVRVGGFRGGRR